MEKDSKIYIAGHRGLVGSAIWNSLAEKGYTNLIGRTIDELNLLDQKAVEKFFAEEKPEYVVLAAAKVGGIVANNTYRGEFIYENLQIQNNVIHQAYLHGVKKLLFLGSTCIYPREAPQPMREDSLLTGPLEYTNEPYAIAKIAGLKMCESYNLQYGTNFIAVMPTNLYGPNDNFDLEKSHVLPALIRKIHLGKCLEEGNWEAIREDLRKRPVSGESGTKRLRDSETEGLRDEVKSEKRKVKSEGDGEKSEITNHRSLITNYQLDGMSIRGYESTTERANEGTMSEGDLLKILGKYGIRVNSSKFAKIVAVEVWGTGKPMREFLWSGDMADACVFIMENVDFKDLVPASGEIRNTHLNIGTGVEISIKELAFLIKDINGFKGDIIFDTSKPDGTMKKLTDPTKLHNLGWHHKIEIEEGIEKQYDWYLTY